MQIFNLRHKRHIHGQKIAIVVVLLLLYCSLGYGQRKVGVNNPNYDNKFLTYGFLIGLHTSTYQLDYSDAFVTPALDSLYAITPDWSAGFSLGFIINLRLSEFLDLRLMPEVAFYEHTLEYRRLDDPEVNELIETTVVEFPLMLKYKSARRGNTRMYLIGGIKPGMEASGKNDVENVGDDNININQYNMSLEAGFGLDIYYPLFKFSPELRFSKGMSNMLGNEKNEFSAGIDRLNTNTITLYLLFQ